MNRAVSQPAEPVVILVAEDNKYDRMILQQVFDELSLNVSLHFVDSGEEALDYLYRRNAHTALLGLPMPALVLLDLNMPRMNGQETLIAIRNDEVLRVLPVILLSTSDNAKQVTQAYAHGVNAFMTKPGPYEEFLELLRKFSTYWLTAAQLPIISKSQT